jgi:hypothetical protein
MLYKSARGKALASSAGAQEPAKLNSAAGFGFTVRLCVSELQLLLRLLLLQMLLLQMLLLQQRQQLLLLQSH